MEWDYGNKIMKTCFGRAAAAGRKAGNDMEKREKQPRGFYVEKGSFFAHAAVTILVLSVAARLLGTMSLWNDKTQLIPQVLLPVGCSLLFILFILLLGRIALWATILPVLGGTAFFVLDLLRQGLGWQLFICIALAFLVAFIYIATLAGMIRSSWILVLVFTLVLAYQIVLRAIPAFKNPEIRFFDGMTLLSSLGMVFAMLLATLAFRRKKKVQPELPKIKDPVVIPPTDPDSAEVSVNAQEISSETAEESISESAVTEAEQLSNISAADAGEIPASEGSSQE